MADLADRMRVLTKHYDLPNEASEALLGGAAEIEVLRTTLARLTADLAAVTSDRDMWRSECESISAELDLPPGIRPAEGELRRMLDHSRALLAEVTTLTAERDEALASATIERTAANEWLAQLHDARKERDEARGLLGEAHHVLDQMHDEDDTIGRLKVDVPDDGYPRQRLFDYVTQYGHGLRARIAAHLGRSE